ncbi:MAG: hypothetical protein ACRDHZ_26765, partial [Ktedonobacteraceae bacterium]
LLAAQAGATVYFLLFNDFWISNTFKYGGIRDWLWMIPFCCLYAYASFRLAWRRLGWIATGAMLVIPVIFWSLPQMQIRPVVSQIASITDTADPTSDPQRNPASNWRCKPAQNGSCTMSVEFAKPVQFDILELRGIQAIKLLYATLKIDGHKSPMFRDHFTSDAPDGSAYVIFYHLEKGKSIKLTIPPPAASPQLSISGIVPARRHYGLRLENPFRRYHPQIQ